MRMYVSVKERLPEKDGEYQVLILKERKDFGNTRTQSTYTVEHIWFIKNAWEDGDFDYFLEDVKYEKLDRSNDGKKDRLELEK